MQEYNKEKIVKYLYENGINTTNRIQTRPLSNERIIQPYELSIINVGADLISDKIFVRFSFVGSQTYYQCSIDRDDIEDWFDIVRFIVDSKKSDSKKSKGMFKDSDNTPDNNIPVF